MLYSQFTGSMRLKIVALVLLVVFPCFSVFFSSARRQRQHIADEVRRDAVRLANFLESDTRRLIGNARELLTVLAFLPEIRQKKFEHCSRFFNDLVKQFPYYANLGITDKNGIAVCSARTMPEGLDLSDRLWFREATATKTFAMGEFQISHAAKRPTINVAYPVMVNEEIRLILVAAIDLGWLDDHHRMKVPEGSEMMILDREGTILADLHTDYDMIGQSAAEVPAVRKVIHTGELPEAEGVLEEKGLDGNNRLYGYKRMDLSGGAGTLYFFVGIPTAIAYKDVYGILRLNIIMTAVTTVFVIIIGLLAGEFLIIRRLKRLIHISKLLSGGDLSVRSRLKYESGEIGDLARNFDQMAAVLEKRIEQSERDQEKLRISERQFRNIAESIRDVFYIFDPDNNRIDFVSPAYEEIWGRSCQSLYNDPKSFLDAVVDEDLERVKSEMRKQKTEQSLNIQYRIRRPDGTITWIDNKSAPVFDEQRGTGYIVGVAEDISERKQYEMALTAKSEMMESILQNIPVMIAFLDSEGNLVYVNRSWENTLGWTLEETAGKDILKECYPDDVYRKHVVDFISTAEGVWAEFRPRTKAGKVIDTEWTNILLTNGARVGIGQDLTSKRTAESALRKSENLLKNIINYSPAVILVRDIEGNLLLSNRNFEPISGCPSELCVGKKLEEFLDTGVAVVLGSYDALMLEQKEPMSVEESVTHRDGTRHTYLSVKFPLLDEAGVPFAFGTISTDITLRKSLEAQISRSQKLEAVGTLAGGIAHDFNNILSSILGFTELMIDSFDPSSEHHHYLNEVFGAAKRAKGLIKQILTFSRQSDHDIKPVRIRQIVEETVSLVRASIPSFIEIRQALHSKAVIMADPTHLHQVIMNMCVNAAHAMKDGPGVLTMELVDIPQKDLSEKLKEKLAGDSYVRLSVSDTGIGIPPKIMEKIFDPFFTTKPVGEGTGLGLSTIYGIITNYGGDVQVESEVGRGTVFHIYLPAIERRPLGEDKKEELVTGSETILLVDDEPPLVEMGTKMLASMGFKVTARVSCIDALALFKEKPARFDLVITDLTMPHMTGLDLAREIRLIRPGIPIVLCTGYSTKITEAEARRYGIRAILVKPFLKEELSQAMRSALSAVPRVGVV